MDTRQALMLLLVAGGAFLVPLVSERIGWFTAPCEMLYGTLVATIFPFARTPDAFITTLAQFGFLLLLFLAGLEIDFTLLRQRGRGALLRAGLAVLALQLLAWGLVTVMHWPFIEIPLLSALSVSLLLVVLHEASIAQTPFGQTVLVVGAIGEFVSIIIVTVYDLVSRFGLNATLGLAVGKLLALLLIGYVTLRVLSRAASEQSRWFRRLFAVRDASELGILAALAFMLTFAAIAVLLRVEQILATFIAGMVCSYAFRGQQIITRKLTTIGQGFFLPIFFISVGINLNIASILHGPALVLVAEILTALIVLRLLIVPLLVLAGLSWSDAIPAALLLSAPLTLLVAIAQVGINLGQLNAGAYGAVLCAAIGSAVIFPLLARPLLSVAQWRREQQQQRVVSVPNATSAHVPRAFMRYEDLFRFDERAEAV